VLHSTRAFTRPVRLSASAVFVRFAMLAPGTMRARLRWAFIVAVAAAVGRAGFWYLNTPHPARPTVAEATAQPLHRRGGALALVYLGSGRPDQRPLTAGRNR
jgi:hypothetical protein